MVAEFSPTAALTLLNNLSWFASLLFKNLHNNSPSFIHSRVSENKSPSTMNLFQNMSSFN